MTTAKVLVVDDHPLIAWATKETLEQMEGIQVVGIAGNAARCLEMVDEFVPDMVILDYHLPDMLGDAITRKIKHKYPHIHIIIFTGIELKESFNHLIELEVSGIISKEAERQDVQALVRCVLRNQTILPLAMFRKLRVMEKKPMQQLTADENQIMSMLLKGYTNEQVAEEIHLSKRSVDNYLKKVYQKYEVKTRAQALEKFIQSRNA